MPDRGIVTRLPCRSSASRRWRGGEPPDDTGYVLEIDRQLVDADRFETGLLDARAVRDTDPGAAIDRLDAALGLWRGPAFAEFPESPWVQAEAVRLEELRLVAVEERIDARRSGGFP